jgi:hypothetical protein
MDADERGSMQSQSPWLDPRLSASIRGKFSFGLSAAMSRPQDAAPRPGLIAEKPRAGECSDCAPGAVEYAFYAGFADGRRRNLFSDAVAPGL